MRPVRIQQVLLVFYSTSFTLQNKLNLQYCHGRSNTHAHVFFGRQESAVLFHCLHLELKTAKCKPHFSLLTFLAFGPCMVRCASRRFRCVVGHPEKASCNRMVCISQPHMTRCINLNPCVRCQQNCSPQLSVCACKHRTTTCRAGPDARCCSVGKQHRREDASR